MISPCSGTYCNGCDQRMSEDHANACQTIDRTPALKAMMRRVAQLTRGSAGKTGIEAFTQAFAEEYGVWPEDVVEIAEHCGSATHEVGGALEVEAR